MDFPVFKRVSPPTRCPRGRPTGPLGRLSQRSPSQAAQPDTHGRQNRSNRVPALHLQLHASPRPPCDARLLFPTQRRNQDRASSARPRSRVRCDPSAERRSQPGEVLMLPSNGLLFYIVMNKRRMPVFTRCLAQLAIAKKTNSELHDVDAYLVQS
jgi:hypothetical protein